MGVVCLERIALRGSHVQQCESWPEGFSSRIRPALNHESSCQFVVFWALDRTHSYPAHFALLEGMLHPRRCLAWRLDDFLHATSWIVGVGIGAELNNVSLNWFLVCAVLVSAALCFASPQRYIVIGIVLLTLAACELAGFGFLRSRR